MRGIKAILLVYKLCAVLAGSLLGTLVMGSSIRIFAGSLLVRPLSKLIDLNRYGSFKAKRS